MSSFKLDQLFSRDLSKLDLLTDQSHRIDDLDPTRGHAKHQAMACQLAHALPSDGHLEAEKQFCRLVGCKDLGVLRKALGRHQEVMKSKDRAGKIIVDRRKFSEIRDILGLYTLLSERKPEAFLTFSNASAMSVASSSLPSSTWWGKVKHSFRAISAFGSGNRLG